MTINGENYFLASMKETHIDDEYLGWLNDKDVNKFLEIRFFKQNRDSALNYLSSFENNMEKKLWGIFSRADNKLVGTVNLTNINRHHRTCMVNIMVGNKDHWGKTAALEGLKLSIQFALKHLKIRKVLASTYAENTSINFTLKQLGFNLEGKLVKNRILRKNYYSDEFKWGLFLKN